MQTPQDSAAATPVNPLERRLDIPLPATLLDEEVERRLKKLAKTTHMAGFRPGKVPLKLIAQQYGAQVRAEATSELIGKAFSHRAESEKIKVAAILKIEPDQTDRGDGQSHFSIVYEIYPEFSLGDLSGQQIEKPILTVGEAEIDKTIEAIRRQHITWQVVDRPATLGDQMVIDYTVTKEGKPLKNGVFKDSTIKLDDERVLSDIRAALEGLSAGDNKVFSVNYPADYHKAELAGQTAEFNVTVKRVEEAQLPELNEEFARRMGIEDGDLNKLRQEVRSNLEREVKKRLDALIKRQVMDALLAVNPIPVPTSLVEEDAERLAKIASQRLQDRGFMVENLSIGRSWFEKEAERHVRLGLIMAELVRAHSLEAKPEQVKAIVEDLAASYEQPQEFVRWFYNQPERLADAQALALENNIVEWVLSQVQVTEKPIAFDELMENKA